MKSTTRGIGNGKAAAGPVGTGWVDRAESPAVIGSLADRVAVQQQLVANGNPGLGGRIGRAQHQKQLLGAFGMFRVRDGLPPEARLGPFAHPGTFKIACRVSNGQPCPFADQAPDVRGLSFKFFAPSGVETDLVMTNEGGRSHASDAAEFTNVAEVLAAFSLKGGAVDAVRKLANVFFKTVGPVRAARVIGILGRQTLLHRVRSMTLEHYWGSVVRLGDAAIKYSVHPHPSTRLGTDADRGRPEYLREDLQNRLGKGPILYDVSLQFFRDEARTPVDDASVPWKAPLVRVGEIEIPVLPSRDDEALIDRMAFNPAHGFAPLGITHVRKVAYETSAENRGALRTEDVRPYFVEAKGRAVSGA
jgi:hypothetical protein